MLTKLLAREACADCKECCVFSRYSTWEQPALSPETRLLAEQILPEAKFISKGESSFLFRIREDYPEDLFLCPLLDTEQGCLLGENKPFECRIYPFQVSEINGRTAITLSPLCEVMMQKPVGILLEFLKQEVAEQIFAYAELHPDVIRPYDDRNLILLWRNETHVKSKL